MSLVVCSQLPTNSGNYRDIPDSQVHTGIPHIFCLTTTCLTSAPVWDLWPSKHPKKLHEQMKCHVEARNLMSVVSCKYAVVGNESGTT